MTDTDTDTDITIASSREARAIATELVAAIADDDQVEVAHLLDRLGIGSTGSLVDLLAEVAYLASRLAAVAGLMAHKPMTGAELLNELAAIDRLTESPNDRRS